MPHQKSISVSQATKSLAASGNISQAVANHLAENDRPVFLADIKRGFHDPVLSCILIDASGSMAECRDAVIQAQREVLDTWRHGANCRNNALFVSQYLFSTEMRQLNPPAQLTATKNDQVVILDTGKYDPDGGTALHTTVYQVLQDIAVNTAYAFSQSMKMKFTLMLISDGQDTEGGADTNDIKTTIQELKAKGHLLISTVIGITHPKFTPAMVNELKERLGFDEAILSSQDPQAIRRACAQGSKSALNAQV
jgi:hypothetical protein